MGKTRNPVVTVIVALILGPFLGMCYANRGKLALLYLFAGITILLACLLSNPAYYNLMVAMWIVGGLHCFLIVKKKGVVKPLKWFAQLWVMAAFAVLPLGVSEYVYSQYEAFFVPGASMSPAINAGDYLFVSKNAYRGGKSLRRGDIVAFHNLPTHSIFIKRVIGFPGDEIQLRKGRLYINENEIRQKKVEDYTRYDRMGPHRVAQFVETLPGGKQYSILIESPDTRAENTEKFKVPAYQYFVIGDYRDKSIDSRDFAAVGFIREDQIIGEAAAVVWNSLSHEFGIKPVE